MGVVRGIRVPLQYGLAVLFRSYTLSRVLSRSGETPEVRLTNSTVVGQEKGDRYDIGRIGNDRIVLDLQYRSCPIFCAAALWACRLACTLCRRQVSRLGRETDSRFVVPLPPHPDPLPRGEREIVLRPILRKELSGTSAPQLTVGARETGSHTAEGRSGRRGSFGGREPGRRRASRRGVGSSCWLRRRSRGRGRAVGRPGCPGR